MGISADHLNHFFIPLVSSFDALPIPIFSSHTRTDLADHHPGLLGRDRFSPGRCPGRGHRVSDRVGLLDDGPGTQDVHQHVVPLYTLPKTQGRTAPAGKGDHSNPSFAHNRSDLPTITSKKGA